jgi:hypothetical protein
VRRPLVALTCLTVALVTGVWIWFLQPNTPVKLAPPAIVAAAKPASANLVNDLALPQLPTEPVPPNPITAIPIGVVQSRMLLTDIAQLDGMRAPGRCGADTVLARNAKDAAWMNANGFPKDYYFERWNRAEIDAAAKGGNVTAMNMLAHLKLEAGEKDWHISPALSKYASAYYARMRAMYELGMLNPSSRSDTGNGLFRPARDVVAGVAWDLIAQRLGDESIMFSADEQSSSTRLPLFLTLTQLGMAYSQADTIITAMNTIRRSNGLPDLAPVAGRRRGN